MKRQLTFVFGDVHGRLDLLERAIAAIVKAPVPAARLIFLGDYVDRGPDSRGVVELLMAAPERYGLDVTCLKGNHEAMMIGAFRKREPRNVQLWLVNGGREAMMSYGWDGVGDPDLSLIPEAHIAWMEALPFIIVDAHRVYVHAGIRPGQPVQKQAERDCLWIRERFLSSGADELRAHVVHGHTPFWLGKPNPAKPELLPHRTNLDTMAYETDVLTVGVFDPEIPGGPIEVISMTPPRPL